MARANLVKSHMQVHPDGGGLLSVVRQLWAEAGAAAFYRGLSPCLLRWVGEANTSGGLYYYLKRDLSRAFPTAAASFVTFEYSSEALKRRIMQQTS